MAFKRSYEKADQSQIRRKIIILIGVISFIVVLVNLAWYSSPKTQKVHLIRVEMIHRDHFIINTNTTNYNKFASTLKTAVIKAKKKYPVNKIELIIPTKLKKSASIADIIMIVSAMNIDWKIKNK